jgi:hypothetical protein
VSDDFLELFNTQIDLNVKEYNTLNYSRTHRSRGSQKETEKRRRDKKGYKSCKKLRKPQSNECDTPPEASKDPPGECQYGDPDDDLPDLIWFSDFLETQDASIVDLCESLSVLAYQVSRAQNFPEFLVAIVACIKSRVKGPLCGKIIKTFLELFKTPESREEQLTVSFDNGFFRNFVHNFSKIKNNKHWKNLELAISGLGSILVADFNGIDWSICGINVIKAHKWSDAKNAGDFIEALLNTIEYFSKTGYRCLKERSLEPLCYEDQDVQRFETEFTRVMGKSSQALSGKLDDNEFGLYSAAVKDLLYRAGCMKKICYSGWAGETLHKKYVQLADLNEQLACQQSASTSRMTPFATVFTGDTAIGKSTIMLLAIRTCLAAMGREFDPIRHANFDTRAGFEDTLYNNTQSVSLDEIGNAKGDNTANFTVPVKRILNCESVPADRSEAHLKGRIYPKPVTAVGSANETHMNAHLYTINPASFLRCFEMHIRMSVQPKYRKEGGNMLNKNHPDLKAKPIHDPPDDVWIFDVEYVHTFMNNNGTYGWCFKTLQGQLHDGTWIVCKQIPLSQLLQVMYNMAKVHYERETRMLHNQKILYKSKACSCGLTPSFCKCAEQKHYNELVMKGKQCQICGHFECVRAHNGAEMQAYHERCDSDQAQELFLKAKYNELYSLEKQKLDSKIQGIVDSCAEKGETFYDDSHVTPNIVGFTPHPESSEDFFVDTGTRILNNWVRSFMPFGLPWHTSIIKSMTTKILLEECDSLMKDYIAPSIFSIVPLSIVTHPTYQKYLKSVYYGHARKDNRKIFKWAFRVLYVLYAVLFWLQPLSVVLMFPFHIALVVVQHVHTIRVRNTMIAALNERRDAFPERFKQIRDHRYGVAFTFAGVAALICAWKLYKGLKPRAETGEAALSPESINSMPGWFSLDTFTKKLSAATSRSSSSATIGQLEHTVQKNLWVGKFKRSDGVTVTTCMFAPRNNVVVFPRHVFHKNANPNNPPCSHVIATAIRHEGVGGHVREFTVEWESCYKFPDMDFVAAFCPHTPSIKSALDWLPHSVQEGSCDVKIVFRDDGGKYQYDTSFATYDPKTCNGFATFPGLSYKTDKTGDGKCMGFVLANTSNPCILGFHLGANNSFGVRKTGYAGTITQTQMRKAYEYLDETFMLSAESRELPDKQYGMIILKSPKAHPKSHALTYGPSAPFEILGSVHVRAQAKSEVEPSILEPHVVKIFDVRKRYGPPQMLPNWRAFNETLDHLAQPERHYPPKLLRRASEDWLKPLIPLVPDFTRRDVFRRLTLKEAIMGIPGKRFMDALVMATSMGFPIMGKKSDYFTDVYNDQGILIDRIPHECIIQELERMMECWQNGYRAYPVFRSVLKDEPKEVGSTKVRVFQCGPVAFTIAVRMFFLSFVRFEGIYPIETECAVGVNAFSRQWDELMNYAEKYGKDRAIAWDYSKFDVKMSSQITHEVYRNYIKLAEESIKHGGYTPEDIKIMKAMVADLTHPIIDWNGTLLELTSINPSGNSLTVQVNGDANGLYGRMHYFNQHPERSSYREDVAAITYGDDADGSVRPGCNFNYHTFKAFMEVYGRKITPPDKDEDNASAYIQDADFLKRRSNYIPEIGIRIGMLSRDSIFKSLMANLKSKSATPREVARSCVEGAIHEAFAFGREEYEDFRAKLKQVCDEADLHVPSLNFDFDERVVMWHTKYTPGFVTPGDRPEM